MAQAISVIESLVSQELITDNLEASPGDFSQIGNYSLHLIDDRFLIHPNNFSQIGKQARVLSKQSNPLSEIPLTGTLEIDEIDNLARGEQTVEELKTIRKEVEEIREVATDVSPVPQEAYDETFAFLKRVPLDIPMPDMMWLESGGIGLEWRPGTGIVTMSLYGDNHVNLVAILGKQHEIAATCPLSDQLLLPSFLEVLSTLFQQRT
jgi:hypothetical protein